MRIAIVIIRNDNGEYLVHKRSRYKRKYPGLLGLGAGGRLEEDEAEEEGASRLLFEETMIVAPIEYLFKENFDNNDIYVFEGLSGQKKIDLSPEFENIGWYTESQVDEMVDKLCPDTKVVYERYKQLKRGQFGN